jgi:PAS domain S-box-containing protein
MPMVEIHATQFLNLLRGDWLKRPSPGVEIGIVALGALLFGFGLLRFRPWAATGMAVAGAVVIVLGAQSLFAFKHIWFAWLIIVAMQIPCGLLFSIIFRSLEWMVQRRKLEEERRRADLRIREQAALLDKAQDAIIVHDLNWQAQYWNKSAENLYGWGFEEVKQMNLRTGLSKTDDARLLEALQNALAKGEWSGELKQTTKDGRSLLVQSRWTLVRDSEGQPKSVFVINTDVTEQKNLEAQFLRTQRMESIGTLAGGIAHDLNNVLTPILMGVELMKMKTKDEHSQKLLTTMASSARRGSDMVKQVLTFARGHIGERSHLQIGHLIREMQKIVKETFPKTIDFSAEIGELSPILGDATQIHQIILNLCVNARDAMPDGGSIMVRAKNVTLSQAEADKFAGAKPINYVLLSTTDTGTGIPAGIIDKIFEPFFTTKEIGKGTGLGLSTVISIIKSHGGFLDLQTEVGKGTTFNVYLPAADSPVAARSAAVPDEDLFGKGETVMVVDDEPAVLELTKNLLIHYGYKVVTAIHGADAVVLCSQYKEMIKVVLMDIMMPVMDGTAAIRALKAQQPRLQFIAISGLMQGDKLKEQIGGEEVTFLAKPYPSEKLLLHLRRLILKPLV